MAYGKKSPFESSPTDAFDQEASPFKGNKLEQWYENSHGCYGDSGRFIPKDEEDYSLKPRISITDPGQIAEADLEEKGEGYCTDVNGWFSGPGIKGKRK